MPDETISILIEPKALHPRLSDPDLRIVELCESNDFQDQRIPGSMHVDYSEIVDGTKPVTGQVPSNERLQRLASRLGLRDELHIVAYDDEGGGHASRLVWTLYLLGHRCASVLNGGIHAWLHEGCPITRTGTTATTTEPAHFAVDDRVLATRDYILSRLGAPNLLFHNDGPDAGGNWHFSDITTSAGVGQPTLRIDGLTVGGTVA